MVINCVCLVMLQIDGHAAHGMTREEAVLRIMSLEEQVNLVVQYRPDEFRRDLAATGSDSGTSHSATQAALYYQCLITICIICSAPYYSSGPDACIIYTPFSIRCPLYIIYVGRFPLLMGVY